MTTKNNPAIIFTNNFNHFFPNVKIKKFLRPQKNFEKLNKASVFMTNESERMLRLLFLKADLVTYYVVGTVLRVF